MNKIVAFIFFIIVGNNINAQILEVKTFGDKKDKPLIFLHGGPGYNSVPFEITTANELAESGFFVISYDRRGEGRNEHLKAKYTFEQTFNDLNQIYEKIGIEKATLIGHSFGGIVATLYTDKFPEKVNSLILVSTPIEMQKTLKHIIEKSKAIYKEKNDKINLGYINMLENMDSTSLEYSSYSLMHAMSNGFYSTKSPNEKAVSLYKQFQTDTLLKKYASKMEYAAPQNFWKNEQYTSISLKESLENLKNKKISIYGIYGKEDGLFSKEQVEELESVLDKKRVKYLENCSHNIFIDQQKEFINLLKKWTE